jgi:propanol-preferring alcohol dehydrogenase
MENPMKAAVVNEFKGPLVIKDIPLPNVKARDVLVKIHACGVCHTDLHAGHEGVGEIVEVGSKIKHLKVGDRVGIPWLYSACGHCDYSLEGQETLCLDQHNAGYSVDGGYAEYCLAHGEYAVKIPGGISYVDAAPLFCAGVTTYKALKVTDVKPGQWVAIVGAGGLGHLAIQYAAAMGMNIIAVDTGEEKLALAKELGATHCIDFMQQKPYEVIHELVGGVHGVVCTAVSKPAFQEAYKAIRRGGACVLVGLPPEEMPIPIFDMVLNGVKVIGSIVGTAQGANWDAIRVVVAASIGGKISKFTGGKFANGAINALGLHKCSMVTSKQKGNSLRKSAGLV